MTSSLKPLLSPNQSIIGSSLRNDMEMASLRYRILGDRYLKRNKDKQPDLTKRGPRPKSRACGKSDILLIDMGVIAYQAVKNLEASINQSHLPAASTEIVHVQLGDANDALRVVECHLALVHSHSSAINASRSLQEYSGSPF